MQKKEIAGFAVEQLKKDYPEAICSLDAADPVQLIIATRLSAQCTDARVFAKVCELGQRTMFSSTNSFKST